MARSGIAAHKQDMCTVVREPLEKYHGLWADTCGRLNWDCLFMLPPWITPWLQHFGAGREPHIYKVSSADGLLGIAPLLVSGGKASLIGSADVCDYLDFIVAPGRQKDFFSALVIHLRRQGIAALDLGPLRPDSAAQAYFGGRGSCSQEDISYELMLPPDWDAYLRGLTVQQRHEVRRKLRRLQEAGRFAYRIVDDPDAIDAAMDMFLHLFMISRPDKRAFMTAAMEAFFRSLARSMADCGLLQLGFLDIDGAPAAAVMCFEYSGTVYLYNSGFDPRFRHLNAGFLCKVLSIRDSIEAGGKIYDFLKGAEIYKHRLGGAPAPLQRCSVLLQD